MRTTITIDDSLYNDAVAASGENNASALVAMALETYLRGESRKRMLKLAGAAPTFSVPGREGRTEWSALEVAEPHTEYGAKYNP